MAKKIKSKSRVEEDARANNNIKEASRLTEISRKLLGMSDDTYQIKSDIELQTSRFDKIINQNLDVIKGVSGGSILDFAQNARINEMRTPRGGISPTNSQDLRKMLSGNSGEIYNYFQEVYQNKYIEIADLKFIAKFIPALGEAVNCQLDSICNADDLSGTISRTIHPDSAMPENVRNQLISTIESLEKEYNLQKKLKNVVYKTALVSGKYYVYHIGYNELFEQYSKERSESADMLNLSNNSMKSYRTMEGVTFNSDGSMSLLNGNRLELGEYAIAVESVNDAIDINELKDIVKDARSDYLDGSESTRDKKGILNALDRFENQLSSRVSTVKIIHSGIPEDILENMPAFEAYQKNVTVQKVNDPNYKGLFDSYFGSTPIDMEAGVVSDDGKSQTTKRAETKFKVTGTYLRYIDPKNIIPVRLMGETIGYYLISSREKVKRVNASTTNTNTNILGTDAFSGAFNIGSLNDKRKMSIVDSIVNSISNTICLNFSKKFVAKNIEFKKAIADCITYNGFLDNEYHVQFIDAKNIIEFTINEDEEGNGESILSNSLFPAKLLLSLITARMLNYLNLSGDTRVAHVAKGPIDTHTGRQTQRMIRNIQETKITFSDLLSTNLVFNKFSRNKNILLPKGRDGTNLVDFEIMDGQNIDMSPEYENKLEQMAILGTGTPSVIMEYVGQSDFAKGFENANIRYATGISGKQADLEVPTTELYNELIRNSNLDDSLKNQILNHFSIKLNRPKALMISNNNEYLGTLQQMMQMISSIMFGENSQDPNIQAVKDIFIKKASTEFAPYIDWNLMESWKKAAEIEAANPANKSSDLDTNTSGGYGSTF